MHLIVYDQAAKTQIYTLQMQHPVCSIKALSENNQGAPLAFVVRTDGELSLLQIRDIKKKAYSLDKVLECKESGYLTSQCMQMILNEASLTIATSQSKRVDDELERRVLVVRIPMK